MCELCDETMSLSIEYIKEASLHLILNIIKKSCHTLVVSNKLTCRIVQDVT